MRSVQATVLAAAVAASAARLLKPAAGVKPHIVCVNTFLRAPSVVWLAVSKLRLKVNLVSFGPRWWCSGMRIGRAHVGTPWVVSPSA